MNKKSNNSIGAGCFLGCSGLVLLVAILGLLGTMLERFGTFPGIAYFLILGVGSLAVMIVLFILLGKYFVAKEEKEQERMQAFKNKLLRLTDTQKQLVINFVKKNKYSPKDVALLRELLAKDNHFFTTEEMGWLLKETRDVEDYRRFELNITSDNPKTLNDYVKNFVHLYGDGDYSGMLKTKPSPVDNAAWQEFLTENESYQIKKDMLARLLNEKNIVYGDLKPLIRQASKEMELDTFKNSLTYESSTSFKEIDSLSGLDFERFLAGLFQRMGYTVEETKISGDQGADLLLEKLGEKIVVQAKRHSNPVNNKAVQEVVASLKHYNADKGMVITTSDFTKSAIELAKSNAIELINRVSLKEMIDKY